MKKIKYSILIILMLFSFYLSDRVTNLAINKNPIMQEIKKQNKTITKSVNATIKDNTIIPGIAGKRINEKESFFKMKEFGEFNELFFVYDSILPEVSISNNKDKVIISGNQSIRQVALIIEDNNNLKKILDQNNIVYTVISNTNTEFSKQEYINGEKEPKQFDDLESILKKNKLNKNICLINYSNIERCKEKEYYLIKPSIEINNNNILFQKNEIENGSIILIDNTISEESLNILLNQIKQLDLNIIYLSEIIKE